jgi:hypothetical protein
MAMTSFDKWKSINESDYASTTSRGLGGATPASRVEDGFENLMTGNMPPLRKAMALVDVLATTLAKLEENDRKAVMNAINSKLKPTVSKFAKLLGNNPNTPE